MRIELSFQRKLRRSFASSAVIGALIFAPQAASAEGLFDFFFGSGQKQQHQAPSQGSFFSDPSDTSSLAQPPRPAVASSGPAFCVRSCDGRYFPLTRGGASPVQMCQAFCPASATKVFYGSSIDGATAASGERYADSDNAYAYRKALRADCTCNGRDPAGLAPIDLALDGSLRPGDVIATSDGLVAYSGVRVGNDLAPDFTPVASYPGLTPEVRARLNDMKVAPVRADMTAGDAPAADPNRAPLPPATPAPKASLSHDKRAEAD